MRILKLVLVIHFWIFTAVFCESFAANRYPCASLLEGSPPREFVAYLEQLLEGRIICETDLERLISALARNVFENPVGENLAFERASHFIHRDRIQKYFEAGLVDIQGLLRWAKRARSQMARDFAQREGARGNTVDLDQPMRFHRVVPGAFSFAGGGRKTEILLTHPIEVMSTLVTQKHWVSVMGENPSRFVDGDTTTTMDVRGKKIKLQPDHPVETVSWWSVLVFANLYSELHGFEPAYDLSGVAFFDRRILPSDPNYGKRLESRAEVIEVASRGSLASLDLKALPKVLTPQGDIYRTKGFRLPTEAEQLYLFSSFPGVEGEDFPNSYVWHADNSNHTTHPVAELKPFVLDGKLFYDLQGNVGEWSYDFLDLHLKGGENPVKDALPTGAVELGRFAAIRGYKGASWSFGDPVWSVRYRNGEYPNIGNDTIGFRLVRTLNPL